MQANHALSLSKLIENLWAPFAYRIMTLFLANGPLPSICSCSGLAGWLFEKWNHATMEIVQKERNEIFLVTVKGSNLLVSLLVFNIENFQEPLT
jgi:hypothetical protein